MKASPKAKMLVEAEPSSNQTAGHETLSADAIILRSRMSIYRR
jgi:hypothetical protein